MARSFTPNNLIDVAALTVLVDTTLISLGAWIKPTADGAIVGGDAGGTTARIFQFKVIGSKVELILFTGTNTAQTALGAINVVDGLLHHVAATWDGTNMRIYVDGVQDVSVAASVTHKIIGKPIRIGAQLAGVTQGAFSGTIADVAYASRAWSAKEVAALGNGMRPTHLGPDHYWPLFGVDSPEIDLGMAAHLTGTLSGTVFATGGSRAEVPLLEV